MAEIQFGAQKSRVELGTLALPNSQKGAGQSEQSPAINQQSREAQNRLEAILDVRLPLRNPARTWDVFLESGSVSSVQPHDPSLLEGPKYNNLVASREIRSDPHTRNMPDSITQAPMPNLALGCGALLAPALCHPHVHLDKCYLLSDPKFSDLGIEEGSFKEAMELTGKAKARFEHDDLVRRGQRLIDESVAAGVSAMRAFVEVDAGVGMKCLDAGLELKRRAEREGRCDVQICAFAQLPLFTGENDGTDVRDLMQEAAERAGVDVLGATPYVEESRAKMEDAVKWIIDLCLRTNKHLDFHLDYNIDPNTEPLVWNLIKTLKDSNWSSKTDKKVVLGHCTRLTLFTSSDWTRLHSEIGDLPISFVGLPTSDLFMMRASEESFTSQPRSTLDVPRMIKRHDLNAAIGVNNIGNAFTPHGSCDPLMLANQGVGVYQAGTTRDAELLYECVSTRARRAIGLELEGRKGGLGIEEGGRADFVMFGRDEIEWRTRKSVAEAMWLYDGGLGRCLVKDGCLVG
ncbi:hypothetical protein LTR66_001746 [Elasticomyces elasticus]|nr:hypothetical protein LTR66_001746 [Elasticomyces elasticus]KAK5009664.1 hypothetical protein LTR28_014047 [Elasticomyces elasticus]